MEYFCQNCKSALESYQRGTPFFPNTDTSDLGDSYTRFLHANLKAQKWHYGLQVHPCLHTYLQPVAANNIHPSSAKIWDLGFEQGFETPKGHNYKSLSKSEPPGPFTTREEGLQLHLVHDSCRIVPKVAIIQFQDRKMFAAEKSIASDIIKQIISACSTGRCMAPHTHQATHGHRVPQGT